MTLTAIIIVCFLALLTAAWFLRECLQTYQELQQRRAQLIWYRDAIRVFKNRIADLQIDGASMAYSSKVFPNTYENCVQYELDQLENRCRLIEQMAFDNSIFENEKF